MDWRRRELQAVEPNHVLHVVAIRPQRMEGVVGTHRNVGVVAEKATAEAIAGIDRLSGDDPRGTGRKVGYGVVQPRVVDVRAKLLTVDATLGRNRSIGTGLPRRDHIRSICREVHSAAG